MPPLSGTDISRSDFSISPVLTITELLEPILLSLDMRTLLTSALRADEKTPRTYEDGFNPILRELFPILFEFCDVPGRGFNDLAIEGLPIGRRRVAFYRLNASWRRMHLRQPPVKHVGLWTLDKINTRKETMRLVKYEHGLKMEVFYSLVLKHVYWWDLSVKWGAAEGQRLPHFNYVRSHMREPALELVQTVDVTIGALADDYCVDHGLARRSVDGSGLTRMEMGRPVADHTSTAGEKGVRSSVEPSGLDKLGIFWFKVVGTDTDGHEVMWKKVDGENASRWKRCLGGEEQV
ncbi:hypothetical protein DHEL01_v201609 [Diaporthe helianthi]|uniref:F-box domain-containing protein n=1 Tax=Diaporthe helianthi TaxID=158607 RepID=A0A2P5IBW0_DIAHE|nr:hypothetical protein DHEL01_v201609 [Diaporthe helianthi]